MSVSAWACQAVWLSARGGASVKTCVRSSQHASIVTSRTVTPAYLEDQADEVNGQKVIDRFEAQACKQNERDETEDEDGVALERLDVTMGRWGR
jgi:hypothetical protein